jgi:apolipoprotein N-acyltransferase
MNEIRPYLVAFSAIISFLAFPPFPFGPLIFVALVPLLYAIDDLPAYRGFKYGYLWGLIFHLGLVYYIGWVTVPGMIATVLILALIPAIALWFYGRLAPRWPALALVIIPAVFLTFNWLLNMSDLNYPWADMGYALAYYLPLIQAADIGGVYLLTLAIFAVNLMVFASISGRFNRVPSAGRSYRLAAVIVILSLYVYGVTRINQLDADVPGENLRVGLVQGNITKDIKWNRDGLDVSFERYFSLTRKAVQDSAELIVWPETAMPTYLAQEPKHMSRVTSFIDDVGLPLLTGVVFYDIDPTGNDPNGDSYIYYNSAIMIEPHKPGYQRYHKVHLVPVSEKLPLSGRVKKLKEIRLGQADFSNGDSLVIFKFNGMAFNVLICFESVFPGFTREFTRLGSKLLVVITNDMWFGRTSLFEQHAMMAIFRAVENRVPVVRAANTGISLAADKVGRILAKTGTFREDYIVVTVHPQESKSIYNAIGDVIPKAALVVALLGLPFAFWQRKEYIDESYAQPAPNHSARHLHSV